MNLQKTVLSLNKGSRLNLPPVKVNYQRISFPGKIHLITNDKELEAIAPQLICSKALGFDTETRASFKVGEIYQVALLQLATENEAFLFRLQAIQQVDLLKEILENSEVLKVGVAIQHDLKILQKKFKFVPQNFIELQSLAKQKGLQNLGLRGMTEEILQASLSKRAKISNWELPTLSSDQIMYAATDAWIGLKLYQTLLNRPDSPKTNL